MGSVISFFYCILLVAFFAAVLYFVIKNAVKAAINESRKEE